MFCLGPGQYPLLTLQCTDHIQDIAVFSNTIGFLLKDMWGSTPSLCLLSFLMLDSRRQKKITEWIWTRPMLIDSKTTKLWCLVHTNKPFFTCNVQFWFILTIIKPFSNLLKFVHHLSFPEKKFHPLLNINKTYNTKPWLLSRLGIWKRWIVHLKWCILK